MGRATGGSGHLPFMAFSQRDAIHKALSRFVFNVDVIQFPS